MEHIEAIYYINLDRRADRREEIEQELDHLGVPQERRKRFPAVDEQPGFVGCAKSHLAVLKEARAMRHRNVLVLEDDFCPVVTPREFWGEIGRFFDSGVDWDVLMLAYNMQRAEPHDDCVGRVLDAHTTSAYLVHQDFYDTLIDTWEQGTEALQQTHAHWLYSIDICWKSLQLCSKWFYFRKRLSVQRTSFSDCSLMVVARGDI